jgi:ribosomal protein S18 acetylase RimI-like enzyme
MRSGAGARPRASRRRSAVLTRLAPNHRAPLADLLARTREFTGEETTVALELVDLALAPGGNADYRFWVDESDEDRARVRGYVCFGKTPMTRGTYDLYWIAVEPSLKSKGVGRALVRAMEDEIAREGAYLVRVETSGLHEYAATRAFYDRVGYEVVARVRDFYARGNDLVMYGRYLGA